MEKVNKICVFLVLSLILFCVGFIAGYNKLKSVSKGIVPDTIVYVDTVKYIKPIVKDSVVVRYKTVRLPIAEDRKPDSPAALPPKKDTARVEIPIESKVYRDSNYTAYISGYNANLDSINVYPRTVFVRQRESRKPPNFGLSLTAGVGYVPGVGLRPFVGAGISYTFKPLRWK